MIQNTTYHEKDQDCTVDPKTWCCTVCGVYHGDPCWVCGGRGFHKPGCPQDTESAVRGITESYRRPL